jgi:hypothetical protein
MPIQARHCSENFQAAVRFRAARVPLDVGFWRPAIPSVTSERIR